MGVRRFSVLVTVVTATLLIAAGCSSDDSGSTASTAGTTLATTTDAPVTSADTTIPDTSTAGPGTTAAPDTTPAPDTSPPDTSAPPTTQAPVDCIAPSDLPPIVAADVDGYDVVDDDTGLGADDDVFVALFTAGGAVATQTTLGDDAGIDWRVGPIGGAGPSGRIEGAILHDLVTTPSGPALIYSEIYEGDEEPWTYLKRLDLDTGTTIDLALAQAMEYFVFRAAAADGIVVTSAYADLTEAIRTFALDGSGELERYTPVLEENYGEPPFYGPAVPSPDGTRLLWLEGPDVSGASETPVGDWYLAAADAVTGDPLLRLRLAGPDEEFAWLEWDGEWAVISRGQGLVALVVHTTDAAVADALCGAGGVGLLTGIVTFVRP